LKNGQPLLGWKVRARASRDSRGSVILDSKLLSQHRVFGAELVDGHLEANALELAVDRNAAAEDQDLVGEGRCTHEEGLGFG
jgi:hypothetical protein